MIFLYLGIILFFAGIVFSQKSIESTEWGYKEKVGMMIAVSWWIIIPIIAVVAITTGFLFGV